MTNKFYVSKTLNRIWLHYFYRLERRRNDGFEIAQ